MTPLICPLCRKVVVAEVAPTPGHPQFCPCLDNPPFTRPLALLVLHLPDGFELRRKEEPAP